MDDNCDKFSLMLSAYFDREIKGSEAKLVEVHLDLCPACKDKLATYNTIRRGLIAISRHTGTKRSLAADILHVLDRDDEILPC